MDALLIIPAYLVLFAMAGVGVLIVEILRNAHRRGMARVRAYDAQQRGN